MWRLLSFDEIPNIVSSHLKFVFQIGVKSASFSSFQDKIGKFEGGSKLRDKTQFIFGVFTYVVGR